MKSDDKRDPDETKDGSNSISKFASPGILLFLDQIFVAAANWIFWLVISRLTVPSEVGQATSVYSLVLLVSTAIQLGLEYPLLRRSSKEPSVFGTALVLELAITAAAIPFIFFIGDALYADSQELVYISIGILVFSSANFIGRFGLLGISNSKTVFMVDVAGTIVKFASALMLVTLGFGAFGILMSFMLQIGVTAAGVLFFSLRFFGLSTPDKERIRVISRDGLANTPSKLSSLLIVSLSVVLLTVMGINDSDVGIFYITVMTSIVAGSFAASLAFMSIPASSMLNSDLSLGSLRLSLVITSPIVAVLVVAPEHILGLIGEAYVSGSTSMVILAIAVLPSAILANAMSRLNNLNDTRRILYMGAVRTAAFIVPFFVLVPVFEILGAAYAILLSVVVSAILPMVWFRNTVRYVAVAICSIAAGVAVGYVASMFIFDHPVITITSALIMSFSVSIILRGTTMKELKMVAKMAKRK